MTRVIIGGKRYDTEKATYLGEVTSDTISGNVEGPIQYRAKLYVKPKTGEHFLWGWGGFLTRFRGEYRILVLDEVEARVLKDMKL